MEKWRYLHRGLRQRPTAIYGMGAGDEGRGRNAIPIRRRLGGRITAIYSFKQLKIAKCQADRACRSRN